jgi:hypothetical protein
LAIRKYRPAPRITIGNNACERDRAIRKGFQTVCPIGRETAGVGADIACASPIIEICSLGVIALCENVIEFDVSCGNGPEAESGIRAIDDSITHERAVGKSAAPIHRHVPAAGNIPEGGTSTIGTIYTDVVRLDIALGGNIQAGTAHAVEADVVECHIVIPVGDRDSVRKRAYPADRTQVVRRAVPTALQRQGMVGPGRQCRSVYRNVPRRIVYSILDLYRTIARRLIYA